MYEVYIADRRLENMDDRALFDLYTKRLTERERADTTTLPHICDELSGVLDERIRREILKSPNRDFYRRTGSTGTSWEITVQGTERTGAAVRYLYRIDPLWCVFVFKMTDSGRNFWTTEEKRLHVLSSIREAVAFVDHQISRLNIQTGGRCYRVPV